MRRDAGDPGPEALLRFAKELQGAATVGELVRMARDEIAAHVGYQAAWLFWADERDALAMHFITATGVPNEVPPEAITLRLDSDPMLQEIASGEHVVVVEDARTDPRTNKEIVAQQGNRTIVNVPLRLVDRALGSLGMGTFGDEGPRPPTPGQLDYVSALAGHLTVALARIQLDEARARARAERQELERQLATAKRLESIGLLAGGVAHDFNNMLAVVLLQAQRLKVSATTPEDRERLGNVIEAASQAAELAGQLLAIGQRTKLVPASVEVGKHLDRFLHLVRSLIPPRIRFEAHAEEGLRVLADRGQLDQILMNLCLNARDAIAAEGSIELRAEAVHVDRERLREHQVPHEGDYVRISVIDSGSGIPAERVDHIFEPFFTTKTPGKGTGLGLSMAHGIAQQHGGHLSCVSTPGRGTTFALYLPSSVESAVPSDRASRPTGVAGHGERILVAEDEPALGALLARMLREGGYEPTVVTNGEAALEAAGAQTFRLAFLDVVMPSIGGLEVAERLRARGAAMPVVLMTGFSADLIDAGPGRLGARVLEKPFQMENVLRLAREALASA